jgi:hypothetical protein
MKRVTYKMLPNTVNRFFYSYFYSFKEIENVINNA